MEVLLKDKEHYICNQLQSKNLLLEKQKLLLNIGKYPTELSSIILTIIYFALLYFNSAEFKIF